MTTPDRPLVLVVDDSALVTEAIGVLLDVAGYRARAAESVADAVRAAREEEPALMLLDLTLPDGDGLTIVRTLDAEGTPRGIAVALTGHDDPDTEARCLDAGCRAVLVKPVRPAPFIAALRGWLGE